MSVTDEISNCGDPDHYGNPDCETYPWFALDWVADDPDAPSQLTIVPGTGDTRTAWISADIRATVPIDECR